MKRRKKPTKQFAFKCKYQRIKDRRRGLTSRTRPQEPERKEAPQEDPDDVEPLTLNKREFLDWKLKMKKRVRQAKDKFKNLKISSIKRDFDNFEKLESKNYHFPELGSESLIDELETQDDAQRKMEKANHLTLEYALLNKRTNNLLEEKAESAPEPKESSDIKLEANSVATATRISAQDSESVYNVKNEDRAEDEDESRILHEPQNKKYLKLLQEITGLIGENQEYKKLILIPSEQVRTNRVIEKYDVCRQGLEGFLKKMMLAFKSKASYTSHFHYKLLLLKFLFDYNLGPEDFARIKNFHLIILRKFLTERYFSFLKDKIYVSLQANVSLSRECSGLMPFLFLDIKSSFKKEKVYFGLTIRELKSIYSKHLIDEKYSQNRSSKLKTFLEGILDLLCQTKQADLVQPTEPDKIKKEAVERKMNSLVCSTVKKEGQGSGAKDKGEAKEPGAEVERLFKCFRVFLNELIDELILNLISTRFKASNISFDSENYQNNISLILLNICKMVLVFMREWLNPPINLSSSSQLRQYWGLQKAKIDSVCKSLARLNLDLIWINLQNYIKQKKALHSLKRKTKWESAKSTRNDEKLKKVYNKVRRHLFNQFCNEIVQKQSRNGVLEISSESDADGKVQSTFFTSSLSKLKRYFENSKKMKLKFAKYYFQDLIARDKTSKLKINHFFEPTSKILPNGKYRSISKKFLCLVMSSRKFRENSMRYFNRCIYLDFLKYYVQDITFRMNSNEFFLLNVQENSFKFPWTLFEIKFAVNFFISEIIRPIKKQLEQA